MKTNQDFVVRFAGEGGQGMVTSAEGLAQAACTVGYHVLTHVTFPSQILGGPTFAQARISAAPIFGPGDELDVLVALDREAYDTHQAEVRDGGVIIYNSEDFQLEGSIRNPCDPPYVDGKEDRGFKQSGLSSNEEETDDCDCDPEEDNP